MFTDSHCHLNFPELSANIAQIREAMAAAKVTRALCISTTMEEFPEVHQLALDYDNFWATVGLHPDPDTDDARPSSTARRIATTWSSGRLIVIFVVMPEGYGDG